MCRTGKNVCRKKFFFPRILSAGFVKMAEAASLAWPPLFEFSVIIVGGFSGRGSEGIPGFDHTPVENVP